MDPADAKPKPNVLSEDTKPDSEEALRRLRAGAPEPSTLKKEDPDVPGLAGAAERPSPANGDDAAAWQDSRKRAPGPYAELVKKRDLALEALARSSGGGQAAGGPPTGATTRLRSRLPLNLVQHVLVFLSFDHSALARTCLVSRGFRAIAQPVLDANIIFTLSSDWEEMMWCVVRPASKALQDSLERNLTKRMAVRSVTFCVNRTSPWRENFSAWQGYVDVPELDEEADEKGGWHVHDLNEGYLNQALAEMDVQPEEAFTALLRRLPDVVSIRFEGSGLRPHGSDADSPRPPRLLQNVRFEHARQWQNPLTELAVAWLKGADIASA
ncbi:hypothetical protein JCM10213_003390 [Rhodosporidiobolus nylandii]